MDTEPVLRVRIADITPEPSDDVSAAIELALHEAWPVPRAEWQPSAAEFTWRTAARPWTRRSIPGRRWGTP